MRMILGVAVLLTAAAGGRAQDADARIPARYDLAPNTRAFPQATPQDALRSAIRAAEAGRYDYLLAHLLDPAVVDARIADRAKLLEGAAEQDLRALRARQRANPFAYTSEQRLPDDPAEFAERVKVEARRRAFRAVAQDAADKFANDLSALRELRRFLREGDFAVQDNAAKVTLRDVKGRAVFLKRAGDRWFVEDRQEEKK